MLIEEDGKTTNKLGGGETMIIEGVAFLLWLCIFINLGALIGKLIIIWKDRIERAKEQQLTNSEGKE